MTNAYKCIGEKRIGNPMNLRKLELNKLFYIQEYIIIYQKITPNLSYKREVRLSNL